MNVNPSLKKMAGYNPTKQTYQMNTLNLCEKIESKDITLPLYQRDLSWTIQKAVDLFNYQLNGKAPVSPISMNKIIDIENHTVPQISFIDRKIIDNVKTNQLSVVDGQQRLSTNYLAYLNSSDFRNIVLDLVRGEFLIIEGSYKKHQIPVGMLLNKVDDEFYKFINSNTTLSKSEVQSVLFQVRSKLRDYSYTINTAENLSEDEQVEWFEVLNNAGSRVTRVQMRFAKLQLYGIDIYNDYTRVYKNKLEEYNLDLFDMKNTEVSIPIANLNPAFEVITHRAHSANFSPMPSDIKENQICTLDTEKLKTCFEITLVALSCALEFINKYHLPTPERIDYVTYLTGYFVFKNADDLTESEFQKLADWYRKVSFSNKSNGQRRKIFNDLITI